jgi:hypothetical protein
VYYAEIKREPNRILIDEYRCDARLRAKAEGLHASHTLVRRRRTIIMGVFFLEFQFFFLVVKGGDVTVDSKTMGFSSSRSAKRS